MSNITIYHNPACDTSRNTLEMIRNNITTSLKHEFASKNDTELHSILPKMSPLNPQYLTKKQRVFQKVTAFVEKFKGVGGSLINEQSRPYRRLAPLIELGY